MHIVLHKNKRIIGLGNKLYTLEQKTTFHEFCISLIKDTFGMEWYDIEMKKEDVLRHTVIKWFDSYNSLRMNPQKDTIKQDNMYSKAANGGTWSLLSLGYDLFTMYDNGLIDKTVIKRLKNYCNFQGIRYEIAVASILLRGNFDIRFIHVNEQHSELLATHKHWKETIEIEAKSKHRKGVLNFEAGSEIQQEIKIGIHHQLNTALKQKSSKYPFFVFIDLNLPLSKDHPTSKDWWKDMYDTFNYTKCSSIENPDKFTCLFLTNFSYHYDKDIDINANEYAQDSGIIIPKYCENPLKHQFYIDILDESLHRYGEIPSSWDKLKPE